MFSVIKRTSAAKDNEQRLEMSDTVAKNSQDSEPRAARTSLWTWAAIGVGTGLLVTVVAGLGYYYLESQRRSKDPRAQKVKDLIEEAEKLLTQSRKANQTRRKEDQARFSSSEQN